MSRPKDPRSPFYCEHLSTAEDSEDLNAFGILLMKQFSITCDPTLSFMRIKERVLQMGLIKPTV